MKILHLLFHPNLETSNVNKIWAKQLQDSGKIALSRDMYKENPNFAFDVQREQEILVQHDRIVIQFPFYWYSVPPLFKKWMDDVLTYNFAYGTQGDKLEGKELQLIISVGGPQEAYSPGSYNNFSVTEFLRPLQQTANLCRMKYLSPMFMNGSVAASEEKIREYGDNFSNLIDDPELSDPWSAQRRIIKAAIKLT